MSSGLLRGGGSSLFRFLEFPRRFFVQPGKFGNQVEEGRNEKYPDEDGCNHAADDPDAYHLPRRCAAPVATARGRQPMIKAMLVIRMGRRRILAASKVAVSRSVP